MCALTPWLVLITVAVITSIITTVPAINCPPGTFFWQREGVEHCQPCLPGCACPGNWTACYGCSGGVFSSASGSSACVPCPLGFTTDWVLNVGCDPFNFLTPCANNFGPLGATACHPVPPPPDVAFAMPTGAEPIPPFYDVDGKPMLQQSY
jgi:hypothetical protein